MKKKKSGEKPYRSIIRNCIWIFRMQFTYAPRSFWAIALAVPLNIGISYWQVYLLSLIVREAVGGREFQEIFCTLGSLSLIVLLLSIGKDVLTRFEGGEKDLFRMRVALRIREKSLSCFYELYEKKEIRDLSERAMRATEMWAGSHPICDISVKTFELIENIVCYLLFGSLIAGINLWLIPVVMIGPIVNLFVMRVYNRWQQKHHVKYMELEQKLHYVTGKSADFAAAKDIRIYSMSDWFREAFQSLTAEMDMGENQQAVRRFLTSLLSLILILVRDSAAYTVLIKMTLDGALTVEQFVLYFAAISSFASFFGNILTSFGKLHELSLRICDVRKYLDLPEQTSGGKESITSHLHCAPEITFDHVSFRYEGATEDTIRDVSFTIHSGESVALVGLNGAGKTTLVKLMCGLYRPTKGEIRLNGIPIEQFAKRDYYRLFSTVFQDSKPAFFSLAETVSGQIGGEVDEQKAESCMRMAGLGDKIDSLPQGIYTKLDKQLHGDAIELSGGEVQKLMLARALYKDAPMLVLDEPTAALDPIAENNIYQEYRHMTVGKSALFISHRLASTRFCDRIIFLKEGKISEEGSHSALMAAKRDYSELYELQSCWYQNDYEAGGGSL
ncbi:MAG: ABC transporter ATP-binding protein [Lachnospiraceae bacterium]|nr:ABC transporter ATP-binding protein [Lachnospiraceae bacterium]